MKDITPKDQTISGAESLRLTKLEKTIDAGVKQFIAVGEALTEIRETRLYRAEFKSFEAYCQKRWQFTRQRAGQLIEAAEVANSLPKSVKLNFTNPSQLNALASLPKEERAGAAEEIIETVKKRGKRMTTKDVEAVVSPPDPEPSPTDAEIDAATSLPPRETSPRPTPAEAQADAQSEAGERMVAAPEPPPKSLWSAPINTVADALAFCGTCDEEGGQWEAAAMLLVSEVDRLNTLLQTTQANMDAVTPDTSQLTPLQLFKELQKNYKPRIPNTLPQPERVKYGIEINKMVIWLMNPVDENGKPLTFSSAYTR